MSHAKPCACRGCRTLTLLGQRYCAQHAEHERARRNQRVADYGYSSANWKAVRAARFELVGHHCELRLDGCTTIATHVHLDPALRGDHRRATVNDVQACCANCSGAIDAPRAHAT